MHFRKILQKCWETASILDVRKSRSTNQNQKENCTEVKDHIWTKIGENQEDLRHSISEVGWTLKKVPLKPMSFQVGIGSLGETLFFQVGFCTSLQTMKHKL